MLNLAPLSTVNLFVSQQEMYSMDYVGMLSQPKKIMKMVFTWKKKISLTPQNIKISPPKNIEIIIDNNWLFARA